MFMQEDFSALLSCIYGSKMPIFALRRFLFFFSGGEMPPSLTVYGNRNGNLQSVAAKIKTKAHRC